MPENYFDERIAATYEAKWPHLFEPAVVDPAVNFLVGLARSDTALELGIGSPLPHGISASMSMTSPRSASPRTTT